MKLMIIATMIGVASVVLAYTAPIGDARTAFVMLAWLGLGFPYSVAVGSVIKRMSQSKSERII